MRVALSIAPMKPSHSLGFLFIGSLMYFLPQIAPGWCGEGAFGFNVRSAWLHLMGLLQVGIGASYLAPQAGAQFAAWLERWPAVATPALAATSPVAPDLHPQPESGLHAFPRRARSEPMGEVIPVNFQPAWSEQRRAA